MLTQEKKRVKSLTLDEKRKIRERELSTFYFLIIVFLSYALIPFLYNLVNYYTTFLESIEINIASEGSFLMSFILGIAAVVYFSSALIKILSNYKYNPELNKQREQKLQKIIDHDHIEKKLKKLIKAISIVYSIIIIIILLAMITSIVLIYTVGIQRYYFLFSVLASAIFTISFFILLNLYYRYLNRKFPLLKEDHNLFDKTVPDVLYISFDKSYKRRVRISIIVLLMGLYSAKFGYMMLFVTETREYVYILVPLLIITLILALVMIIPTIFGKFMKVQKEEEGKEREKNSSKH